MKKYITWILGAVCALALVTSTFAADTNTVATVKAQSAQTDSLFNAKEFGLSLATGYTIDTSAAFQQDYTFNLNAGAFWYPWRYAGLEFNVPFYQTTGVSVDEVQAGVVLRLPLSKTTPVLKNISPYIGLGGVYNWDTVENWAYITKVGTEFRFNKKWGIFAEGQYRNVDFDWGDGQTSLNGGLRLVF